MREVSTLATGTSIEWTEATWNPTTGCDRISTGCDHCYALTLAKRLKAMGNPKYQNDGDARTSGAGFGVAEHPLSLKIPHTWKKPRHVFVNSMSDIFHARISSDFIQEVFEVMADTPQHTYQVLTKRPRRAVKMAGELNWPANVWLGVTVETEEYAWRVDELGRTPAAVKFVSAEPLLGPLPNLNLSQVDWLIVGGESGKGHRPLEKEWVTALRDRASAESVAFFFKQWGGHTPKANGRMLDGETFDEMPARAA